MEDLLILFSYNLVFFFKFYFKYNYCYNFFTAEISLHITRDNLIWRPVFNAGVIYTLVARINDMEPWRQVCTPNSMVPQCNIYDREGTFSCHETPGNSTVPTSSVDVLLAEMKLLDLGMPNVLTVEFVANGNCSSYNREILTCFCGNLNVC